MDFTFKSNNNQCYLLCKSGERGKSKLLSENIF